VGGKRIPKISLNFEPHWFQDWNMNQRGPRRIMKFYRQLKAECGCDSLAKDQLCKRAAYWAVVVETLEVQSLENEELDPGPLVHASNLLIGILKQLGLRNVGKVKESKLKEYLADRARKDGKRIARDQSHKRLAVKRGLVAVN